MHCWKADAWTSCLGSKRERWLWCVKKTGLLQKLVATRICMFAVFVNTNAVSYSHRNQTFVSAICWNASSLWMKFLVLKTRNLKTTDNSNYRISRTRMDISPAYYNIARVGAFPLWLCTNCRLHCSVRQTEKPEECCEVIKRKRLEIGLKYP